MRLSAAAVSVLAFLAACYDSTGPDTHLTVFVVAAAPTMEVLAHADTSGPQIHCDVSFLARAEGTGSAIWGDAVAYFFFGPERTTPIDSTVLPASDIRDSWGAQDIDEAHPRHATWGVTASAPFAVRFVYKYSTNGVEKKTDPVEVTCGPTIPPGSPPPTFNTAVMQPASGEINSGDTLTVSYSASSAVGLWKTDLVITGACNLSMSFPEVLQLNVSHTQRIAIPPECRLGTALTVKVQAVDAALRGIQTQLGAVTVVDRRAPEMSAAFGWTTSPTMGAHVFAGDTIQLGIGAADNHGLGGAFWVVTPQGQRDSLRMYGPSWAQSNSVPIQSSWTGTMGMRVYVRDSVGNTSDTLVVPDTIKIVALATHPVRISVPVPNLRSMAVAEPRGMVYGVPWNSQLILGMSTQSMTIADTIALPSNGGDIDVTANGDTLVVALPVQRAIGVIDLNATPRTVTVVPLTSLPDTTTWPERLRVTANGKAFLTLAWTPNTPASALVLMEVDLHSGTNRVRTDAGAGGAVGSALIGRSLDHTVMVLNGLYGIQRYASGPDMFDPARVLNGMESFQPFMDATGARIVLGDSIFDSAFNFARTFETPSPYSRVPAALSPDGSVVYHYVWPTGVMRDDAQTGALLERSRLPFQTFDIRMSRDGKMLIIYDGQFSRIAVMDLSS